MNARIPWYWMFAMLAACEAGLAGEDLPAADARADSAATGDVRWDAPAPADVPDTLSCGVFDVCVGFDVAWDTHADGPDAARDVPDASDQGPDTSDTSDTLDAADTADTSDTAAGQNDAGDPGGCLNPSAELCRASVLEPTAGESLVWTGDTARVREEHCGVACATEMQSYWDCFDGCLEDGGGPQTCQALPHCGTELDDSRRCFDACQLAAPADPWRVFPFPRETWVERHARPTTDAVLQARIEADATSSMSLSLASQLRGALIERLNLSWYVDGAEGRPLEVISGWQKGHAGFVEQRLLLVETMDPSDPTSTLTTEVTLLTPTASGDCLRPGVLLIGGHGEDSVWSSRAHGGHLYAEQGAVVLAVTIHGLGAGDGHAWESRLNGFPVKGQGVIQALMAERFLRGLPETDPTRVAVQGHSGGSSLTNVYVAISKAVRLVATDWAATYPGYEADGWSDELTDFHCDVEPDLREIWLQILRPPPSQPVDETLRHAEWDDLIKNGAGVPLRRRLRSYMSQGWLYEAFYRQEQERELTCWLRDGLPF